MRVAPGPHQLAGRVACLIRDHARQQGSAKQVERKAQRDVATALVQLAAQALRALGAADVELVSLVARRQRHAVELGDVPAFDDVAPPPGLRAQALDQLRDLVDARTLAEGPLARGLVSRPIDPLLAVYRAEIAPLRSERLVL